MKATASEKVDLAIIVQKQSNTGMFKNQRLLLIKSGFLSYFSAIPKFYVGNVRSLELSGELPKMTLCASAVQSIERKRKYLHIKFNKKHLISSQKLKIYIEGASPDKKEKNNDNEEEEWVVKCENVEEADTFMQQVLLYKNDPNFKPQIENIVDGYREGKKWFRSESMRITNVKGVNSSSAHRFSEQPQAIINKFRTNSVSGMSFLHDEPAHNKVVEQSEITNPIPQKQEEQNEQEQPKAESRPAEKSQPQSQPQSQPVKAQSQTIFHIRQQKEVVDSYSKDTYPYYPFVKAKKGLRKEELDVSFRRFVNGDKRLIEKLSKNQISKAKVQVEPKKEEPKPKRSLTVGNIKKEVQKEKPLPVKQEESSNRTSSWSELKRLKRAYSLFGAMSNHPQEEDQQQKNQEREEKGEENQEPEIKLEKQVEKVVQKENPVYLQSKIEIKEEEKWMFILDQPPKQEGGMFILNQPQEEKEEQKEDQKQIQKQNQSSLNTQSTAQQDHKPQQQPDPPITPPEQPPQYQPTIQAPHIQQPKQPQHTIQQTQTTQQPAQQTIQQPPAIIQPTLKPEQKPETQLLPVVILSVGPEPEPAEEEHQSFDYLNQSNKISETNTEETHQEFVLGPQDKRDMLKLKLEEEIEEPKQDIPAICIKEPVQMKIQPVKEEKIPVLFPPVVKEPVIQPVTLSALEIIEEKEQDAISFKDLEIGQKHDSYPLTPRFWDIPQPTQTIPQHSSTQIPPNTASTSQTHKTTPQPRQQSPTKQAPKHSQQIQAQQQVTTYINQLLHTKHTHELGNTIRKLTACTWSMQEDMPGEVVLELRGIKREGVYRRVAIGLLVDYVEGRIREDGVDCQGIMLGKRVRWQGWCLYICNRSTYTNIFSFYQQLHPQPPNTPKYRPAKLYGLQYKSHHAVFLQQPQNNHKVPASIMQHIRQLAGGEQLPGEQIVVGEDGETGELVLWVNPDYLGAWGQEDERVGLGVQWGLIDSVVQYAWQQYQSADPAQSQTKLQTIKLLFSTYSLHIYHTTSKHPQTYTPCLLHTPQPQQPSPITNLHNTLPHLPPAQSHKILHWKALQLLAQSDLHPQQYLDIYAFIDVFSVVAELFVVQGLYGRAEQVCGYCVAVFVGEEMLGDLLGVGEVGVGGNKLGVVLGVLQERDSGRLLECLLVNLVLLFQCRQKLQPDTAKLAKLYKSILSLMQQTYQTLTNNHPTHPKLPQIHSYYNMLLHSTQQQPAQAYKHAQVILHNCPNAEAKRVKAAQLAVLGYIDWLGGQGKGEQAVGVVEEELRMAGEGDGVYLVELQCRRDLWLLHTSNAFTCQHFFNYLEFYLKQPSAQLSLIKALTDAICSQFAFNDEPVFYQLLSILQRSELPTQIIDGLTELGLNRLQPSIRKRIEKRICS